MVIAAVMVATLFNGANISTWTSWVFFALGIEILLIWVYTVSRLHPSLLSGRSSPLQAVYSTIKPGWFPTYVYGNDTFLFHSAYYWLCLLLVIPLALVPRLSLKAYKFMFYPSDMDRVRYLHKLYPDHDFAADRQFGGVSYLKNAVDTTRGVRRMSLIRRSLPRTHTGSRTDMSTGVRTAGPGTGFDFSMEENGPALRRLQSNLSGVSQPAQRNKRRRSLLRSLGRSVRRKKVPTTLPEEEETLPSDPSPPPAPKT